MSQSLNLQRYEVKGLKELADTLDQLGKAIGDKQLNSKILIPVMQKAMEPALNTAKQRAPKGDTGILENSLYITARRPTRKDKRSLYITESDSVVAIVSTKPIPKRLKNKFNIEHADIIANFAKTKKGTKARELATKQLRTAKQKFYHDKGFAYDGRVPAMEFGTKTELGTARIAARPYLRPAIEENQQTITNLLAQLLRQELEMYRENHRP